MQGLSIWLIEVSQFRHNVVTSTTDAYLNWNESHRNSPEVTGHSSYVSSDRAMKLSTVMSILSILLSAYTLVEYQSTGVFVQLCYPQQIDS